MIDYLFPNNTTVNIVKTPIPTALPKPTKDTPLKFVELNGTFDKGINKIEIKRIIYYQKKK